VNNQLPCQLPTRGKTFGQAVGFVQNARFSGISGMRCPKIGQWVLKVAEVAGVGANCRNIAWAVAENRCEGGWCGMRKE